MNDRMYARRGDPGEPGDAARARRRRDRARRGRARLARRARRRAGCPSPRALLDARSRRSLPGRPRPLGRPAGAGHRRRHPRADRPGALHRQPLQRPHGPRARRGGRPPRRRGDPGRRQRRAARAAPASRRVDVETAAELGAAVRDRVRRRRRAADGRRRRPTSGRRRRSRGRSRASGRTASSCDLEPTEDILAGLAAARRDGPDARRLRRRARAPTRSSAPAAKLERKGVDAIVFNDVSRPEIGFDSHRERGDDRRARRRAPRAARLQGRGRRRDPRPGRGAPVPDRAPRAEPRD